MMVISARLDQKIAIQALTISNDGMGSSSETYATVSGAPTWAEYIPLKGLERIEAGRVSEKEQFKLDCQHAALMMKSLYDKWRKVDGAKECCRVFLPEGLTMSNMAFKASVRTWLHYLDVRDDDKATQKEHVLVARAIREEIAPYFPAIIGASK